jgi:hypothetical protein
MEPAMEIGFKGLTIGCLAFILIFAILVVFLPVAELDASYGIWILIGIGSLSYGVVAPVLIISWVLTGFHHASDIIKNVVRAVVALPLIIAEIIGVMNNWLYYWQDPWKRMFLVGFAWIKGFEELISFMR